MLKEKVNIAILSLFVLLVLCFITFFSLIWYPYDPVTFTDLIVDKPLYSPGDRVCFKIVGTKLSAVPARVYVELMDGENIALVNYVSNMPVGTKCATRCTRIPYHVNTGTYRLNWTGFFEMNNFKTVVRNIASKPFRVVVER